MYIYRVIMKVKTHFFNLKRFDVSLLRLRFSVHIYIYIYFQFFMYPKFFMHFLHILPGQPFGLQSFYLLCKNVYAVCIFQFS